MKTRRKNPNSTPQRSSNQTNYSLISTNPNKNLSLDRFSFKCIYFSLSELFKSIKRIFLFFYYQTFLNHDLSLERALPKKKSLERGRERMRLGRQFGADLEEGGRQWFRENGTRSRPPSRPQQSSQVSAFIPVLATMELADLGHHLGVGLLTDRWVW